MAITYLFAGIPVSNRDASAQWYSNLFASEPIYPNDDEAMWQLVGSGSLYVIVSSDAGAGTVTLIVDGLDSTLVELRGRGVDIADPVEIPGAARKALVRDPDGNQVWFVELTS